MNRKITGGYVLFVGVFSLVLACILAGLSPVEPETDMGLTEWLIVGLIIGCLILVLNGLKWLRGAKINKRGKTVGRLRHYIVSLLVMYTSSCVFGSSMLILVLQFQEGGEPTTEAIAILLPVIIVGFVTMAMVRQTMRDPGIIEEYGWDEENVLKSTGVFRVLVAMFLPVLIIMIFLLLFMYVGLSAAYGGSYRHCPKCGRTLDAENYCSSCNTKYY